MAKPPYKIPSMAEIAAVKGTNGLSVVSTFSGCGGSCLGFEMAGFDVRWALEFVDAARDTYRLNHPGVLVDGRDVRLVQPHEVLTAIGKARGEVDVLEGSPPCSSFSTAGKREKGWGKAKAYSTDKVQRTDDLFFEFARLLEGIKPRAFVAENVRGLVIGSAKGYFKEILRALKACGYRVGVRVLDAQWLGVPQQRQRTIFVGFRDDLGIEPEHPKPLPYNYTVRDAIPWVSRVVHDTSGTFGAGDITDRPAPAVTVGVNSINSRHFQVEADSNIDPYAIGAEWLKLRPGDQSDRYFNLVRAHPDRPCPTVTQTGGTLSAASVTHPFERRKFSIAELRRICGYPDDFELTGTYGQQWERLARSVPPPMMRAVAEVVRDKLLAHAAAAAGAR